MLFPFLIKVVILGIYLQITEGQLCSQLRSCSDCVRKPTCFWCGNMEILSSEQYKRCTSAANDSNWINWCGKENIVAFENKLTMLKDEDLSTSDDDLEEVIQIKPQRVHLKLAVGKKQEIKFKFKYVQDYPLDLYYLMDLSKSMEGDKNTIERLADDLARELQKLTKHHRLGFGSFLDKVMLPFINTDPEFLTNPCEGASQSCRAPYGFQNILSLTNDTTKFMNAVRNAKISTNLDEPEGGLDGLLQTILCQSIGWEESKTRHLIVYVSGSPFKYAADGKLAGITRPFDMTCHLDAEGYYTQSSLLDYPSVAQVNEASKMENKHIIFAVKKGVLPVHEALSELVVQSSASEIQKDSSNIIEIITTFYKNISGTVTFGDNSTLTDIQMSYFSNCNGLVTTETNECHDIDTEEEVEFTLEVKLKKCPSDPKTPLVIQVSPLHLKDEMLIEIEPLCVCSCDEEENRKPNAEECNGKGTYQCGACKCNEGHSGEHCECLDFSSGSTISHQELCKAPNDTSGAVCSGHGICKCGECICNTGVLGNPGWVYEGKFCDCSNFDCPKKGNFLCSDHGHCECNECICKSGWKGGDCSCQDSQQQCLNPIDKKMCSDHGSCKCNQCRCGQVKGTSGERYTGKWCEDCRNCKGLCDKYANCVKCGVFEIGPLMNSCEESCSFITINLVSSLDEVKNDKICSYEDDDGCRIRFFYNPNIDDIVFVVEEPECPAEVKVWAIVLGVVSIILLLGVVALVVWKISVTIKDKREYEKFLKESQNAKFTEGVNPLYRDPVTHVQNPMRGIET